MNLPDKRAKPGDRVMLTMIPPGLLDGLPEEDQHAIPVGQRNR